LGAVPSNFTTPLTDGAEVSAAAFASQRPEPTTANTVIIASETYLVFVSEILIGFYLPFRLSIHFVQPLSPIR
jgi:hypothetical protein